MIKLKKLFSLILAICLILSTFSSCAAVYYLKYRPKQPVIKYGEFPYEITWQIDGQIYSKSSAYICEYVETTTMSRHWAGYGRGAVPSDYLELHQDGEVDICCYLGDPGYYMDDEEYRSVDYLPGDIIYRIDGMELELLSEEAGDEADVLLAEMKEKYRDIIVSATFSDPIKNEFK